MSLADEFLADAQPKSTLAKRGSLAEEFVSDAKAAPAVAEKSGGTGSDVIDGGNAVGTGFFRGLTRFAGLPVDTAQNVIDLGKAVLGMPYLLAGKVPPDALQLRDRKTVVGSGDYLVDKLSKTAPGNLMINPVNPDYEGGYLQAGGAGLTAVLSPNNARQAINQAALGVTGAVGGKAVVDATGNPALGVIASLTPSAIQQGATAATKAAVIGANPFSEKSMAAKRQEIADRMTTLRDAGIENPTLGLATGNKFIGGVENLLQSTPGAIGVMGRSRDAALAGLKAKTEESANLASPNRGALESGVAIQGGIRDFRDRFKATQEGLYDHLDNFIDPLSPTRVDNTLGTFSKVNSDIKGAPEVSRFFKNGKIQSLEDAFRSDTAGAPATVMVVPQPPRAGGGIMNAPVPQDPLLVHIPEGPARNTLPWQAVKQTRTLVGREIADSNLLSDVPRSKWDALYGGLSEDMGNAARAADRADSPGAMQAFNRATDYTRVGMQRLDRVAPFATTTAPEQAFTAMVNATKENVSTLQAVKKTLPPDARGTIAGTVIERLGKATNGVQNAEGTAWSPETFLTNWNRMTPRARQELFSGFPNSAEVARNVESVAKAADMMRTSSKMWANPSGTGANLAGRVTLGGLGAGAAAAATGLLNPWMVVGAGGLLGANYLTARALTGPFVVREMTQGNTVSPQHLGAQTIPMFSSGLLSQQ